MTQPRHTPLSLRTQLVALSSEVAAADAGDYFANDRTAHQLASLKSQLERDGFHDVGEQAQVALRLAEMLKDGGSLSAGQGHELLGLVIRAMATALGIELAPACQVVGPSNESSNASAPAAKPTELRLATSRRLGEILVQMSLLTPSQVEQALAHQRMTGCRLGEALVQMRLVSKNTIETVLRSQGLRRNTSNDPWRAVS